MVEIAAPWCITKYINDYNYLNGDKSWTAERTRNPRTANCDLIENTRLTNDASETSYRALEIRSLVPIAIGQELFLDYGPDHDHHDLV